MQDQYSSPPLSSVDPKPRASLTHRTERHKPRRSSLALLEPSPKQFTWLTSIRLDTQGGSGSILLISKQGLARLLGGLPKSYTRIGVVMGGGTTLSIYLHGSHYCKRQAPRAVRRGEHRSCVFNHAENPPEGQHQRLLVDLTVQTICHEAICQ